MKKKRLLSLLLSAIMLVGSMPALVLAEGNEGEEDDPVITDGELDEGGDEDGDVRHLGDMPENSVFTVGQMEANELLVFQFTPSTTGRYGFLCADGRDLNVAIYDDKGEIAPIEEKRDYRYVVQYLNLEAGKAYSVKIESGEDNTLSDRDVYCYACPMSETLPYGESTLFVKSRDGYTKHTFIPEVSGQHIFEFTPLRSDHYVSLELFSGSEQQAYSYTQGKLVADLKAGVPYDFKITYNRGFESYSYNVLKVNIRKDVPALKVGENPAQLKPDNEISFFSFTPESSGVYVFETKGEFDTQATLVNSGNDYGEGKNFRLGLYLTEGKTYYLQISQASSEQVTVPVYVRHAEQIQPEQEYSFDGMYSDNYYYAITTTKSGWYHLDSGNSSHSITVCDSNNNYPLRILDFWYMEAGKVYYVIYQHYGEEAATVKFSVDRITSDLIVDSSSAVSNFTALNNCFYTVFTPEVSGVYQFASDHTINHFDIYDTRSSIVSVGFYNNAKLDRTAYLFANTPYLIYFTSYSNNDIPYVVTLKKSENNVTTDVEYAVDFPSDVRKQYSFTPETSGYYWIYSFGGVSIGAIHEGTKDLYGTSGSGQLGFQSKMVELEAGKTYGLEFYHSETNLDGLYWCIHKVDPLTPGKDIDIDVIGGYAYYTFTPSENGVYTFTSDVFETAWDYSALQVKKVTKYSEDMVNVATLSNSQLNNGFTAVLEKGKTYLLNVQMKTKVSGSYTMDIVKEQALEVGDNTVPITNRNTNHDFQRNGFCSFTPEKDGLYAIMSHGEKGVDPHIVVYDSQKNKVGEDDISGDVYWNFKVELFLNGGETYFIDIDETEEFDLPVEIKELEIMEAKLEGYSLSLDGSIAINLYMTLSDKVADSKTSVLEYTRADGSMLYYSMDKAEKREMNGKNYYVFHLPVAAKEMTSELKAQIVDPDSAFEGKEYTFTVQDYAKYIIENAYSPDDYSVIQNQEFYEALPLITALLNYGTAAQKYFGINVDDPANSIIPDTYMGNVPTSALPAYNKDNEVLPDGVSFEGASLSIESETDLTFYLSNPSGAKLSFTDSNGKRLTSRVKGEYTTVKVKGIPAHKLGEPVTIRIKVEGDANDYKVSYIPMTYCYNVLTRSLTETRTAELKELMKAFYFYHKAAVAYMAGRSGN